jgi:hypothetical protein
MRKPMHALNPIYHEGSNTTSFLGWENFFHGGIEKVLKKLNTSAVFILHV